MKIETKRFSSKLYEQYDNAKHDIINFYKKNGKNAIVNPKKYDIDLIVDFDPIDVANYADNYFDLKFSLQDILHRSVDLLEEKALKNPYFRQAISQNRKLVYGH